MSWRYNEMSGNILGFRLRSVARHMGFLLTTLTLLVVANPATAKIINVIIQTRTSPAFGGASFGDVGQYEQLTGVAYGEVDPKDPLNAVITDILLAPRNARGMVEYSMDFAITKPIDMSRGNRTLLYDVPNRGNIRSPELNVGGSASNIGDGFLEREGYTLVDSGWEGDLTTGLQIRLPVAGRRDSSEIRERVRSEYILGTAANTLDVTEPPAYEAVSTDNSGATLTRRVHQNDPRELISNVQWSFADCSSAPFPGIPDPKKICLQGGFDTNHIYELLYTAKNPMVMGLGFAATRDFVSFLRSGNHGSSVNPLAMG